MIIHLENLYHTQLCKSGTTGGIVPSLIKYGVSAVIGPATSGSSANSQLVFREFHIPQISYSATSTALSDKLTYPYFTRTVPSDAFQGKAMLAFLNHIFRRICDRSQTGSEFFLSDRLQLATIASSDSYGQGITNLHSDSERWEINVVSSQFFNMHTTIQVMRPFVRDLANSGAKMFVVFAQAVDTAIILAVNKKKERSKKKK